MQSFFVTVSPMARVSTSGRTETKVVSVRLDARIVKELDKRAAEVQRKRGNLLAVIVHEYLKEKP